MKTVNQSPKLAAHLAQACSASGEGISSVLSSRQQTTDALNWAFKVAQTKMVKDGSLTNHSEDLMRCH